MEKLFIHLYDIKKNHALYLTDKSLRLLRAYIDGYISGQICEQGGITHYGQPMRDFCRFIEKRYDFTESIPQGWCKIIEFYSSSDSAAFDTFFERLDEFLQSRGCESEKLDTQ